MFLLFIVASAILHSISYVHGLVSSAPLAQGTWVSMGVYSDGSYGIQPGLIYSFPVTCEKEEWSIVEGKFSALPTKCFKLLPYMLEYIPFYFHE